MQEQNQNQQLKQITQGQRKMRGVDHLTHVMEAEVGKITVWIAEKVATPLLMPQHDKLVFVTDRYPSGFDDAASFEIVRAHLAQADPEWARSYVLDTFDDLIDEWAADAYVLPAALTELEGRVFTFAELKSYAKTGVTVGLKRRPRLPETTGDDMAQRRPVAMTHVARKMHFFVAELVARPTMERDRLTFFTTRDFRRLTDDERVHLIREAMTDFDPRWGDEFYTDAGPLDIACSDAIVLPESELTRTFSVRDTEPYGQWRVQATMQRKAPPKRFLDASVEESVERPMKHPRVKVCQ